MAEEEDLERFWERLRTPKIIVPAPPTAKELEHFQVPFTYAYDPVVYVAAVCDLAHPMTYFGASLTHVQLFSQPCVLSIAMQEYTAYGIAAWTFIPTVNWTDAAALRWKTTDAPLHCFLFQSPQWVQIGGSLNAGAVLHMGAQMLPGLRVV